MSKLKKQVGAESAAADKSQMSEEDLSLLRRLRGRRMSHLQTPHQLMLHAYRAALADQSADAHHHHSMASSLHFRGRYREALQCYDLAVEAEPFIPFALAARAGLLASCPEEGLRNGTQALKDARRAFEAAATAGELQEEWKLRGYAVVLAAAMAECKDYEGAKAELVRAIQQVQTRKSKAFLTDCLQQVELGMPIRTSRSLMSRGSIAPLLFPGNG